jgi:hypothetical protein
MSKISFFNGGGGIFLDVLFFMYDIQYCFVCRPSDSTVSEDAEIEPSARSYRPCFRENKPKTLVLMNDTERFGLVFAKTAWVIRESDLKGLSHEMDFYNVDENGQILALLSAAAGF